MNESILIIEDDPVISHFVEMALKANHYEPLHESSGLKGIATFLRVRPALVLLDLGLPDIDGIEALKEIRLASSDVPLLIVSARDKEEEKVKALDLGADDYVTKPFGISELLARIRTALRHNNVDATKDSFSFKGLLVDYEKRLVLCGGEVLHFTPIEYKILVLLISKQGKVLSHRYIQEEVWHYETQDDYQSLRVFVASIRKKLAEKSNEPFIVTEVGVGYRFLE